MACPSTHTYTHTHTDLEDGLPLLRRDDDVALFVHELLRDDLSSLLAYLRWRQSYRVKGLFNQGFLRCACCVRQCQLLLYNIDRPMQENDPIHFSGLAYWSCDSLSLCWATQQAKPQSVGVKRPNNSFHQPHVPRRAVLRVPHCSTLIGRSHSFWLLWPMDVGERRTQNTASLFCILGEQGLSYSCSPLKQQHVTCSCCISCPGWIWIWLPSSSWICCPSTSTGTSCSTKYVTSSPEMCHYGSGHVRATWQKVVCTHHRKRKAIHNRCFPGITSCLSTDFYSRRGIFPTQTPLPMASTPFHHFLEWRSHFGLCSPAPTPGIPPPARYRSVSFVFPMTDHNCHNQSHPSAVEDGREGSAARSFPVQPHILTSYMLSKCSHADKLLLNFWKHWKVRFANGQAYPLP